MAIWSDIPYRTWFLKLWVFAKYLKLKTFDQDDLPRVDILEGGISSSTSTGLTAILYNDHNWLYFEYGSTEEALVMLSDELINYRDTANLEKTTCVSCKGKKNPIEGARCRAGTQLLDVYTVVCVDCSRSVRRELIKQGTPEYSTGEILAKEWENVPMDGL